jgi:hypothetical protein
MKRLLPLVVLLAGLGAGCAFWEYQDTKIRSTGIYLAVDAVQQNFGYERLEINRRLRAPLHRFLADRPPPDFIYEYNEATREGIRLFYLTEDRVYDFLEQNVNPGSIHLKETRALNSYEKAYFRELASRQAL